MGRPDSHPGIPRYPVHHRIRSNRADAFPGIKYLFILKNFLRTDVQYHDRWLAKSTKAIPSKTRLSRIEAVFSMRHLHQRPLRFMWQSLCRPLSRSKRKRRPYFILNFYNCIFYKDFWLFRSDFIRVSLLLTSTRMHRSAPCTGREIT